MFGALLVVHIAGGSTALLSMFIPMIAKKGGTVHRRAGWVFVGGMTIVSITALVLSAGRFISDPSPGGRIAGLFLFYIAVLTGGGVSAGVRALRFKARTDRHRHAWDVGVAATIAASGVMMAAFGLAIQQPLLIAFSIIGVANGGGQLAYWLRPPAHPMHWWFEHMNLMLGSCIAATTAFLVNNAGVLGLPPTSLVVWLAPTAVGVPAIVFWIRYYRRRFSGPLARGSRRTAESVTTGDLLNDCKDAIAESSASLAS
jgi:hypothetical protein